MNRDTEPLDMSKVQKNMEDFKNDEASLDMLSRIFKALGDPTRLKIIYALSHGTLNVSQLVDLLGMSQSSISHQLRLLRSEKLVKDTRVGRKIYYSLDDDHVIGLFDQGYEHVQHKRQGRD